MTTANDDTRDRLGVMPLRCPDNAATHYAGCPCNEAAWQERLAETEAKLARAEAALLEIEEGACRRNWYTGGRSLYCADIVSVRRAGWCPSCTARAYFAEGGR